APGPGPRGGSPRPCPSSSRPWSSSAVAESLASLTVLAVATVVLSACALVPWPDNSEPVLPPPLAIVISNSPNQNPRIGFMRGETIASLFFDFVQEANDASLRDGASLRARSGGASYRARL